MVQHTSQCFNANHHIKCTKLLHILCTTNTRPLLHMLQTFIHLIKHHLSHPSQCITSRGGSASYSCSTHNQNPCTAHHFSSSNITIQGACTTQLHKSPPTVRHKSQHFTLKHSHVRCITNHHTQCKKQHYIQCTNHTIYGEPNTPHMVHKP